MPKIRFYLEQLFDYKISHIYREVNKAVNLLANLGVDRKEK